MPRVNPFFYTLRLVAFLLFSNCVLFYTQIRLPLFLSILLTIVTGGLFMLCLIAHRHHIGGNRRLASLLHGLSLTSSAVWLLLCETLLLLLLCMGRMPPVGELLLQCGIFALCYILLLLSGVGRILIHTRQKGAGKTLLFLLFWWVPLAGLLLGIRLYRRARRELHTEVVRLALDAARPENDYCRTRYPILMVHGIFFRDWQLFGYWGRIPAALIRNGARIFYGKQQSSQPVAQSAQELAQQIRRICQETGAQKVNIIAHSKGGLDSRYAMQFYGCTPLVASLTTINTPHQGVPFVDAALSGIPMGIQKWVARRYEKIFTILGDTAPDFLGGVRDLTVAHCRQFNREVPVPEGVFMQTTMSSMRRAGSAGFPLNIGYLVCRRSGGSNDGLVPVEAARLAGVPHIIVPQTRRRGISHGDMIDLMREDIPDFDVMEWYVQLVHGLKERGL